MIRKRLTELLAPLEKEVGSSRIITLASLPWQSQSSDVGRRRVCNDDPWINIKLKLLEDGLGILVHLMLVNQAQDLVLGSGPTDIFMTRLEPDPVPDDGPGQHVPKLVLGC